MIQRYMTDEGESFSMMTYSPYQLEETLNIPVDKICTIVDVTSDKFEGIYHAYVEAFALKMSTLPDFDTEEDESTEQRTIH